jgi:hypothetical protein
MSSLTPLLDAQILRLRRRIGDIYNEDGTDIDSSNVYSSTSGTTWKQQELLDIYNDSIKSFMIYMTKTFDKSKWWENMPGYVVTNENQAVTTGKMLMSNLSPTVFQLMDIKKYNTTLPSDLSTFVAPDEWFPMKNGLVKTRKPDTTHIFHTVMGDATQGAVSPETLTQTTITGIDSSLHTITRGSGSFTTGSYVTITLVSFAGAILFQFVVRLTSTGATASYTVLAGTEATFNPSSQNCSVIVGQANNAVPSSLYILPTSISTIDLIYLRDHTDYVQNALPDLNGISQDGLRRVLIFAEQESRAWKSTESADLPQAQVQTMMAMDAKQQGGKNATGS